jgi:hypothetical protein
MASVTLTTLLARTRERADMVGSSFVADAATGLYAWINEANQKLHGMLVEALGEEYISSSASITIVAGTSSYALPSGFFKLYGIDWTAGSYVHSMKPYERGERATYRNSGVGANNVPRYSLVGSNLRLYPAPQTVVPVTMLYAPEATVLTTGTDTVNYPNGWERFIVLDAAIQCLAKEESDVRTLVAEREKVVREIELAKEQRDLNAVHRVIEVDLVEVDPLW